MNAGKRTRPLSDLSSEAPPEGSETPREE